MDESVNDETVEANASPARTVAAADQETATPARSAADTAATTTAGPRELSINELEKLDDLFPVARDFNLHLHPARTRHHHIFDIARAALGQGANVTAEGFLDQVADSFGLLRYPELNFLPEKGLVLDDVITIEGEPAEKWSEPTDFEKLTPQFPQGRIMLENPKTNSICARGVDLLAPLGHGQRGLIVAPPRVGKTILLKEIAKAIQVNHPEIVLILLLVDERPEEVTDLEREIDCQIYHSNFDENVTRHVQVAEMVLERAKRLVEMKKDVVILLDSLTRLSRGYNNLQPSKGRIMSGGVEAKALTKPKKFFGSARNVEEGGSLTILATALTETGSRMDELIFEEFKGTGNMELHLDRALQEKRLYPAIHPMLSATRREDLLYHPEEWERVQLLRKAMAALPPIEAMEKLIDNLNATKTNAELLLSGLK